MTLTVLLCLGLALVALLRLRVPAPPGPDGQEGAFGSGSDWDRQWVMAAVGAESWRRGERPDWDPWTGAGSPLAANPESPVLHPAFRLGGPHSPAWGLRALLAAQALLGALGATLLLRRLGTHGELGPALAAFWLGSTEFTRRTYGGHLMAWGLLAWPLALAATLGACDAARNGRWRATFLEGALAGGALAVASLGGAHYPVILGATALALLGFAELLTGPRRGALLLRAPAAVAGGLLAIGALTGRRAWELVNLLPYSERAVPRTVGSLRIDRPPLQDLLDGFPYGLEGAMHVGGTGPYALLALGLCVLVLRRPALGLVALFLGGAGLLAGSKADPWPLLLRVPGFALLDYPGRLQWFFFLLGPVGLVTLLPAERRFRHAGWVALGVGALAVGHAAFTLEPVEARTPAAAPGERQAPTTIRGLAPHGLPLVTAAHQGLLSLGADLPLTFDHPPEASPEGALAWHDDGSSAELAYERGAIVVRGRPGAKVHVRQRFLPGWACGGAVVGIPPWDRKMYWLTITMGPDGEARCRWRSPGATRGNVLQAAAALLLITVSGTALAGWRADRAGPAPGARPAPTTGSTPPPPRP